MESLDFKIINGPLKVVNSNMISYIEGDSGNDFFRFLCTSFLRIADNNYDAVRCLVVKNFRFCAPAQIICRSSLELVYNLCLIASNPNKYGPLYAKAGWREEREALDKYNEDDYYATNGAEWLNEYSKNVKRSALLHSITDEEQQNYNKIDYFPYAPQIIKNPSRFFEESDVETINLLALLFSSYYKPLSQVSHMAESGLSTNIGGLLEEPSQDTKDIATSEPILISMMCMLILLSEINIAFNCGFNEKLKETWMYLALTVPIQKEIYEIKYQKVL